MQSLPDNVIRQVLELSRADNIIPSILTPTVVPVLLTHVSRRWKEVAQSTPVLWSSISITFRQTGKDADARDGGNAEGRALEDISFMRQWLSLSATFPLSIEFVSVNTPIFEGMNQFFLYLMELAPRWQRLYFTPVSGRLDGIPLDFSQSLLSINLPLLDTIHFGDIAHIIRPNSFLLRGKRLREIAYMCSSLDHSVECPSQVADLNTRWPFLTSLKLSCGRHHLDDYLTVLRRCPSLVHFSVTEEHFHFHFHSRSTPPDLAPVLLPHLQALSLCLNHDALQACFHVLNTPTLQDFSFRWNKFHSHPPDSAATSLMSFLSRSHLTGNSKIRRLAIDPIHFTKSTFYQLLKSFPCLDTLILRTDFNRDVQRFNLPKDASPPGLGSYLNDTFLSMLSGGRFSHTSRALTQSLAQRRVAGAMRLAEAAGSTSPSTQPLLAQLTRFTCLTRTSFTENALLSFVKSRRPGPSSSSTITQSTVVVAQGTTSAVLRYLTLAETEEGRLCESEILPTGSVTQRLQPFVDDGLVVDICQYYPGVVTT